MQRRDYIIIKKVIAEINIGTRKSFLHMSRMLKDNTFKGR